MIDWLQALPGLAPRLLVVAALAFSVAEGWRRFALRRGVLDVPGHRSSHVVATPRGAGIGIAVGVAVALALWGPGGASGSAVLLGLLAVAVVGLMDDLRPMRASLKFLGQFLSAIPVAVALPFSPEGMPIPLPPPIGIAVSVALLLLFANAWNFMDGIDGIASVAAMAVAASVLLAGCLGGEGSGSIIALALIAACAGFLPLNLPKAKAFMGDCGSHVLGFGAAILVLAAPSLPMASVALVASAAFLVDVLGTLMLRARDGERLASAHRRHLYQLATRCGYSHGRVTMAYAAWMLASGGGMAMALTSGFAGVFAVLNLASTALAWWLMQRHFRSNLEERGQW